VKQRTGDREVFRMENDKKKRRKKEILRKSRLEKGI
jgi:hypothetical protein